jgi:UDP-GlcNAc:undecaprenyl-phosphate GlcNAc-1-phosphate transferase
VTPLALLVLLVVLVTASAAAILVPATRALARFTGALDAPGPRKVHETPTPRLGGLAVSFSFGAVALVGHQLAGPLASHPWTQALLNGHVALLRDAEKVEAKLLAVLLGGGFVALVGLVDDLLGARFPVWAKALGQVLAACILLAAGIQTEFLPQPWMNVVVTIVWVVGITNAFNLLDNMDGLSAGVAFVVSGVLLVNAWALGEFFIVLLLAAFMGALLGFLYFNVNPASVFLGDTGSLFIGFILAALTLLERYVSTASSGLFPVLMPVLVLAVPILDTSTVTFIRLREGRPVYVGDRCHLSHRLVDLGLSKSHAVLVIWLASLGLGLGAVALPDATPFVTVLILLQALAMTAVFLILVFFDRRLVRSTEPALVAQGGNTGSGAPNGNGTELSSAGFTPAAGGLRQGP